MKKLLIILLIFNFQFPVFNLHAQSSAVQKAGKSVFTLTTYKADGTIIDTTHGVYCGSQGEGIAAFTPFIGAASAQIIDAAGKKADVTAIIGANDMYDICRFQLSAKGGTPLQVATTPATGQVWEVGYSVKKPAIKAVNVASSETFAEKFNYYIFKEEVDLDNLGCPIVNNQGQLLGLSQRSSSNYILHSTDAAYYLDLHSTGLDNQNQLLKKTSIRIALPEDHEQARLMLIMLDGNSDSLNVVNTVNDYNAKYPTDLDGYYTLARYNLSHNNVAAADDYMAMALKKVRDKAEAYAQYSELIYNNVIYNDSIPGWSLDKAEENINAAIAIQDKPAYKHQLARILYAKGDYQEALTLFEEVDKTDLASSTVTYEMAQCKTHLNASKEDILVLLDKSVEQCPKPYTQTAAPFLLSRGSWLSEMGKYREALSDYATYDTLMYFNASADFYYARYNCEMKLRQYQQALNDIAHAAYLAPHELTYIVEMASLNLRVARYEEAVQICDLGLRLSADDSDLYIIKGVALHQLSMKTPSDSPIMGRNYDAEALEAIQKAKELGDERADGYIEKFTTTSKKKK